MDMPNMTMPMSNSTKTMKMGMHLSFFWGKDVVILFDSWPNHSLSMYILALFVVFCLASTLELLSTISKAKLGTSPIVGRLIQSLVYAVRMAMAYLVMLSIMSYNVGVFIVVVAGHALGHFFVMFLEIRQANTERINDPDV